MFQLCDLDEDGCMVPYDILLMLQRLERLFVRETARIDIKSQILLNSIADKRAEKNFHFVMTSYRNLNIQKEMKAKQKAQEEEDRKNNVESKSKSMHTAIIDIQKNKLKEDSLITYREFMQALKFYKFGANDDDTLYKTILPRTLTFQEVLRRLPVKEMEEEYEVSDT
jgi:hypothetical protein